MNDRVSETEKERNITGELKLLHQGNYIIDYKCDFHSSG